MNVLLKFWTDLELFLCIRLLLAGPVEIFKFLFWGLACKFARLSAFSVSSINRSCSNSVSLLKINCLLSVPLLSGLWLEGEVLTNLRFSAFILVMSELKSESMIEISFSGPCTRLLEVLAIAGWLWLVFNLKP